MAENGLEIWAKGYESAVLTMKAMIKGRLQAYPVVDETNEMRINALRDVMADVESLETVAKSLRNSA